MRIVFPSSLLKKSLAADAVVSGAVAALQLAMPDALSRLLMLPRSLLLETGTFLVAYSLLLVFLARSARVWSGLIALVVLGNVGWAAGCAMLLGAGYLKPGALGLAFVALQAATVLLFAGLEYLGLRNSLPAVTSRVAQT
jgi:hypothetical protein